MDARGLKPNVLLVLADQWRAQAFGYAGDPNVRTPNIDAFAAQSTNFRYAVSGCPVCTPYRASLLTGQYPLTHGLFTNDVPLDAGIPGMGDVFRDNGYDTAYIGKWHVDGRGRTAFIPRERRKGFEHWQAFECSHDYWNSFYYENDDPKPKRWEGYDADAQTDAAIRWIEQRRRGDKPFLMVLSWGPPHDPIVPKPQGVAPDDWYWGAPEEFRRLYDPGALELRPNVEDVAHDVRPKLAGYYAHCSALDHCFGRLVRALGARGLDKDTLVLFTSDHGDILGSHGAGQKQNPFDESIRVPFLLRRPGASGAETNDALIDAPDILPTLAGLCGIACPGAVEGTDWSPFFGAGRTPPEKPALIASYHAFGYYTPRFGGREYRGIRTLRHTYVRDRNGPWLFFDNETDPYQTDNLVNDSVRAELRRDLDRTLQGLLGQRGDEFLPGEAYLDQWRYPHDLHP